MLLIARGENVFWTRLKLYDVVSSIRFTHIAITSGGSAMKNDRNADSNVLLSKLKWFPVILSND